MSEPQQRPGKSKQDYATPAEFIDAVVDRFGPLAYDLAADATNHKAASYFTAEQDSLKQDWTRLRGNLWLNPPFCDIAPWAAKCAETCHEMVMGDRILMLVPASVGSNWFLQHVYHRALVIALNPRMSFDGKAPFPKDLILAAYGRPPGFEVWRWKNAKKVAA